jgi:uncharacterized membrane protein
MNLEMVLIPLAVLMTAAVVVSLFTRLIATAFLHRTIREALRADPGSVPLLVEKIDRHPPWGDALLGWIFLAIASAMALLGLTEADGEDRTETLRAAMVPAIVGIAALLYARFSARGVPRG